VIDIAEEALAAGRSMARLDEETGLLPGERLAVPLRARSNSAR
jgi:hypothetical protein